MSRGSTALEIFRRGSPQLKPFLASPAFLGCRMERSTVFPAAKYVHDSASKSRGSKPPAPIQDQALFCDCLACRGTVCPITILEEPGREKRLSFANSLPTTTFASRETRTYLVFPESSLLTRFLAQTRQHVRSPILSPTTEISTLIDSQMFSRRFLGRIRSMNCSVRSSGHGISQTRTLCRE